MEFIYWKIIFEVIIEIIIKRWNISPLPVPWLPLHNKERILWQLVDLLTWLFMIAPPAPIKLHLNSLIFHLLIVEKISSSSSAIKMWLVIQYSKKWHATQKSWPQSIHGANVKNLWTINQKIDGLFSQQPLIFLQHLSQVLLLLPLLNSESNMFELSAPNFGWAWLPEFINHALSFYWNLSPV